MMMKGRNGESNTSRLSFLYASLHRAGSNYEQSQATRCLRPDALSTWSLVKQQTVELSVLVKKDLSSTSKPLPRVRS